MYVRARACKKNTKYVCPLLNIQAGTGQSRVVLLLPLVQVALGVKSRMSKTNIIMMMMIIICIIIILFYQASERALAAFDSEVIAFRLTAVD